MAVRFCLILFLLTINLNFCKSSDMQVFITRVAQCKGKDDLAVYIPVWRIDQRKKNEFFLSGYIELREDFPQGFKLKIDVQKCKDNVNSCDPFMNNVATKNLCQLLNSKAALYTQFVDSVEPRITCPLKMGNYTVAELKHDNSLLDFLPGTGLSYWHATFKGSENNRDILCINVDLNVRPKRTKKD